MFPQTSETFIVNEILALERLGLALRIYSYRRPVEEVPHEALSRIRAPVTYLPDPLARHAPELLGAQREWWRLDRARHRAAVADALTQSARERSLQPARRLLQAGALALRLREDRVTHIHAHFAHEATRVAMLAARLTGLPFSYTAHARDIYSDDVDYRLLREKTERAQFAVTETEFNRSFIRSRIGAAAASNLHVVHNGVDLERFAPGLAPAAADDVPLVLAVGRLVEKKGFPTLIAACRLLHARGRHFRCEIVGYGDLRAQLEDEISRAGLDDVVQLVGMRSQDELPAMYRRAAVFAMPAVIGTDGNRDSLPTVLLEALACGVPVVASRVTGIPEIVDDGENGLLVEPGDADELSRALERLLDDHELRRRFAEAGRTKAHERFDIDTNARELYRLLSGRHAPAESVSRADRVPVM
jgi:glycosyltransferase involved in cell wall biosynthesis